MPMAHRNGFIRTAHAAGRAVFAGRTVAGRPFRAPSRAMPPATSRRR